MSLSPGGELSISKYFFLPGAPYFQRLEPVVMKLGQQTAISGIIMPHNWDETGRIIEIALYTNTEDVYVVEHNSLARELMNLLHKRVAIRGKLSEHPDGNRSIAANNYVLLKEILDT